MPIFEKVFNSTLETFEKQIDGQVFKCAPRSFFDIQEAYSSIIESEYADKGVFVYRPGDDFKAKERQSLLQYLNYLKHAKYNFQAYLDEGKKAGLTLEKPKKMVRIERWISEIETLLNAQAPIEYEPSFINEDDIKTKNIEESIFAVKPEVQEFKDNLEKIISDENQKKRGRPKADSFSEVIA